MTESKKCKTGYYYCFTDEKCKKIPMGYHIGARGYLARDNDEDSEEGKKNGNGKNGSSNGNGGTNGGSNGGNGGVSEGTLHKWFKGSKSKDGKGGWVNVVTGGTCASDEPGEGTPKCVSSAKRASMSKAERKSAARRKKEADPGQQQKSGAAKPTYVSTDSKRKKVDEEAVSKKQQRFFGMVRAAQKGEMENPSPEVAKVAATAKRSDVKKFASTKHKGLPMKKVEESISEAKDKKGKGSGTKDACYHKVKSRYSVWPSAYASGALVKCRKAGAANWGNKSEEFEMQEKTAHSGSVTFSSKAVPAKATDDSIKSAVSKALAKPGTSHSASSEKGKRENKVGVNYSMSYSSGGDKKKEKNKDKKDKKKPVLKKKGGHGDPGKPNKPSSGGGGGRNRGGSGGGGGSRLRSGGGSETRPSASRTGSRTGGSTLSRGTTSSSGGRALMRNSFTDLRDILDEKCWKGYEKKGMKTMFGKRYPNCVKKKATNEEAEMVRYCPKCEKNETRDECSYGPKTWDMYSVPANLGPNTFEEKYERIQRLGKTYTVFFTFRGQYKSLQFFFPTSARPSREEVLIQLRKIYPEAVLTNYFERDRVENEPLVQVEGAKSFGQFKSDSQQLNEFLPGTGRVVAGRSQRGANPAGGSRFTTAGTVQKVFGVTIPGSFRKGVSQSDVDRHNRRAPSNAQIRPTNQSDDQLLGRKPGGQRTVGITPDPRPRTPTRTASQSRAQSTSGYGKVGAIGNVGGNLRFIKDRRAAAASAAADAQRRARGLSNSYEPEGEMVEDKENNPRRTGRPNNPSALERIDAATPGPGAFTYYGFKQKHGKPYTYNNPHTGPNYDKNKTTYTQRREYIAGGGNAAMKDKNQTADQVRAQGRRNLEARPPNPNVHNWKDGKTKVYAGNPPMRFNVGEGRSVYGSGQLRPYDQIKMGGGGKLKSIKDLDAELKKKKGVKEDWQSVNKKDKTDGMSPKAVAAYRRENPGSKLKTAVTGDPKPGSKDAKRRKSFCARSKGQQDMHNIDCSKTPDKPVCKARRRWKC